MLWELSSSKETSIFFSIFWCFLFSCLLCSPLSSKEPSHFMLAPGIFNVDKDRRWFMIQGEYRWELDCHHVRPLASGFVVSSKAFFVCGGVAYDIFPFTKKVVITPSFAAGVYYHGDGKNLGFPINFRSAIELAVVLGNKGRFGAQFHHISNARMLFHNPGVDNFVIFYAIPIPR